MAAFRAPAAVIVGSVVLFYGCAGSPDGAASLTSVTFMGDCQDKLYFDTLSASDHKTIVKGMSDDERDACYRAASQPGGGGGGM